MSEYDEIMEGLNEVLDVKTRQTDIGIDLMLSMAEVKMLKREVERLKAELHNCRNELCLKCGKYREAHNGACDGCRWKADIERSNT